MTDTIHVLVVEDKLLIAEDIASKLRKHSLVVDGIFQSGEETLEHIKNSQPDLVLMDIQLDGKLDGITTASMIKRQWPDISIVYLSDLKDAETLQRAKKTMPDNYLTKPFLEADLIRAIDLAFFTSQNRANSKREASSNAVFLRTDSQVYVKIALKDIFYLEAERAYCKVICRDKTYIMSTSMNHICEQINSGDFIKVHRSFTINVNNITGFNGNVVRIGDHEIQMNKEGKDLLGAMLKFIK